MKKNRNIRVFVSSTFQDMQEERDLLVKKIFPQLKKLCSERGVGFTEVDLRWGVTQEQLERGEVLPICLAEIENCRPYFIGILGDRYGWIPDKIPDYLLSREAWLHEHNNKSITELEIIHGVLNNPKMANHAFFYFRYSPQPQQIEPIATKDDNYLKLQNLKAKLRNSSFPVREDYKNPEALGELVYTDLKAAIEKEFPKQNLTPVERERFDHSTFAESRAKFYIERKQYFDALNNHVGKGGKPLVVIGESGAGKSALLANWAIKFQNGHQDVFTITHFIASNTVSTSYLNVLRRIFAEIKERYNLTNEIPEAKEKLLTDFPNWLSLAASRGSLVLLIDGLNQLEKSDNSQELFWLPEIFPDNISVILSTLPGKCLTILNKRGCDCLSVKPLSNEERQTFIDNYLFQLYSKKLPIESVKQIADNERCSNPLFLRSLLEELRIFGKHEDLFQQINHYLQARTTEQLFIKILNRLEQDFEKERKGLVRESMTLIYAARRGLSEQEILDLLKIPRLLWSPLHLALGESLINRSGLITFHHPFLRNAAYSQYIVTEDNLKKIHLRLASYFQATENSQRKFDELPWQLSRSESWNALANCLIDSSFLKMVYQKNKYEILKYWQQIEGNTSFSCTNTLELISKKPDIDKEIVLIISDLLRIRGDLKAAQQALDILYEHSRESLSNDELLQVLYLLGVINITLNHLTKATKLFLELESVSRKLNNTFFLAKAFHGQADILIIQTDYRSAWILLKKEEKVYADENDMSALVSLYSGMSEILINLLDDYHGALTLCKKQEQISRAIGDKYHLQLSLEFQAGIYSDFDDYDEALDLYKQQETICKELGDHVCFRRSLENQASILMHQGHDRLAFEALRKSKTAFINRHSLTSLISLEIGSIIKYSSFFKLAQKCKQLLNIIIKNIRFLITNRHQGISTKQDLWENSPDRTGKADADPHKRSDGMGSASPNTIEPIIAISPMSSPGDEQLNNDNTTSKPHIGLLLQHDGPAADINKNDIYSTSDKLENALLEYGLSGIITGICPGPFVISYLYSLASGITIDSLTALEAHLSQEIGIAHIRVIQSNLKISLTEFEQYNIEIPNKIITYPFFYDLMVPKEFQHAPSPVMIGLGWEVYGMLVYFDLAELPHLLICGSDDDERRSAINIIVSSILFKATAHQVHLLFIDQSNNELSVFSHVPHLLNISPTINSDKCLASLQWTVSEMDRRIQIITQPRNPACDNNCTVNNFPYLIIIIHDMNNFIKQSPQNCLHLLRKLTQKAHDVRIHLVVSSASLPTSPLNEEIQAIFTTKICFHVNSSKESLSILDSTGAEHLLGRGDFLFKSSRSPILQRLHLAKLSVNEIKRIVSSFK